MVGKLKARTISLILKHHGHRLKCLLLSSTEPLAENNKAHGRGDFATVPFLRNLRQSCVVLEEIFLGMFRSKGDASEVTIYRALRQISSLRKVHLSILCPQTFTWDKVSFDNFIDLCN